ncbi:hypothetical protein [Streptococcus danieliae]
MFSLTNNSSKNNTFSFDGGNLTNYGGLLLFNPNYSYLKQLRVNS